MWRCTALVFLFVFFHGALQPGAASAQVGQRLCSSGANDGQPCSSPEQCPGGVCVVAQGVCEGRVDEVDCDCPGSECLSTPVCSNDPEAGTCAGGPYAGECCSVEFNCPDGSPCRGTQKVCLTGELEGFACLEDSQCDGSPCVSTGRVCTGDGFSCVNSEDCSSGTCEGGPLPPTPTTTPTRPLATRTPGPSMCVGDCDSDGAVTIDNILVMVNVALEVSPVNACLAGDANGDGTITVDEIILAVNNALGECPM